PGPELDVFAAVVAVDADLGRARDAQRPVAGTTLLAEWEVAQRIGYVPTLDARVAKLAVEKDRGAVVKAESMWLEAVAVAGIFLAAVLRFAHERSRRRVSG